MTFERLRLADWVALLAALLLLFVMAMDWYTTPHGQEARRIQRELSDTPRTGPAGEDLRNARNRAKEEGEGSEKNAWQADGRIDRIILLSLMAAAGLAIAAAVLRAAGRQFEPPLTPSALAALAAVGSALLVTYRIVQEPGIDEFTTVKAGAPLAVIVLGALALGAASAMRAEAAGTAFREPAPPPKQADEQPTA
jgi:drug/metabolite transporter (DMT)-like permease